MVKLTAKDIQHIAKLAKLELSKKDIAKFQKQLTEVLTHINELQKVNTAGVEPMGQTTGLKNVFREEEIGSSSVLSQEESLSGTENMHSGYFKVPVILEKNI